MLRALWLFSDHFLQDQGFHQLCLCLLSQHIMILDLWHFKSLLLKKMWHSGLSVVEILEREINNLRHMVDSSRKTLGEKRQKDSRSRKRTNASSSYLSFCSFS
jgi:hypothetical protein